MLPYLCFSGTIIPWTLAWTMPMNNTDDIFCCLLRSSHLLSTFMVKVAENQIVTHAHLINYFSQQIRFKSCSLVKLLYTSMISKEPKGNKLFPREEAHKIKPIWNIIYTWFWHTVKGKICLDMVSAEQTNKF